MKILIKTKLLDEKHIELRGYELNQQELKVILCSNKNYKSCFHLGEPYQIFTLAQQKAGKVTNTQTSKFPPFKTYLMYKFLWKPAKKVATKQLDGKTITYVGNTAIIK